MNKKIIIGTRASKLALLYAQRAKNKILEKSDLKSEDIIIKKISTKGDEIQEIRLSEFGGKGLFLSTIEEELQNKNIDIEYNRFTTIKQNSGNKSGLTIKDKVYI